MFEYIKGTVAHLYPGYIVIDNQGIGYKILMANPFRYTDQISQETLIYVYQDVKQDSMQLFGFKTMQEKNLFLKLINVSGIGPKSALAILANDNHKGFVQAIEDNNVTFLTKFPGVGKKTAQQIVLDLKGKLSEFEGTDVEGLEGQQAFDMPEGSNQSFEEAIEALLALGYTKKDVARVRKQFDDRKKLSTDAYIREALSYLMKK
ncbi:Holliday junction branch migration protein RuvA [Alkalibacterium pelagium]|uniref:Holliday junction branch migration complex subunit RuvA n=1 Tax=Alkalibacterium pelagium TaxID=426702 RepID=A0A1H7NAJ9_9LACT|nr:Holliday junction branch migration protein RuvA [Alkalibacterium pelagium]GEN51392.1 Holliday junction ATP-dependent DNA helicase RuvA [Alkalibacterium pelagium]SEL20523.1 Holliday junction DNA helicase subunit RuvA [Alkalibacterium pelagium]